MVRLTSVQRIKIMGCAGFAPMQASKPWGQEPPEVCGSGITKETTMESLLPLLIQLGSGAIGGNVAGKIMPQNSLGTIGNSIAGIAGGGIGGTLLSMVMGGAATGGAMSMGGILSSIAGGGIGGTVLMAVIGIVRGMMNK
jgi:hypothetical protein